MNIEVDNIQDFLTVVREKDNKKHQIAGNKVVESNDHLSEGSSRSKNEEEKIDIHV